MPIGILGSLVIYALFYIFCFRMSLPVLPHIPILLKRVKKPPFRMQSGITWLITHGLLRLFHLLYSEDSHRLSW